MYQGHQADGSSIQNHSCGSHYPFVVGAYHCGPLLHFVLYPDGQMRRFNTGLEAIRFARALAEAKRSH